MLMMTEESLRRACTQAAISLMQEPYDGARQFAAQGKRDSCVIDRMAALIEDRMRYALVVQENDSERGGLWPTR
jgi:hypothetical protein